MIKLTKAIRFAGLAHAKIRQTRNGNGEPYINHPIRVAEIVANYIGQFTSDTELICDVLCAAYLHDTVEDTGVTITEIGLMFGTRVADLVQELTNKAASFAERKRALLVKAERMTDFARLIKMADRLDNVSDFESTGPDFAKRYSGETVALLNCLQKGTQVWEKFEPLKIKIQEKINPYLPSA